MSYSQSKTVSRNDTDLIVIIQNLNKMPVPIVVLNLRFVIAFHDQMYFAS